MRSIRKNQAGFTMVELLIATAIFAVILLGAALTLIQVSRMYYKGVISSRTQEAARNIMDNLSRPIQLEGANVTWNLQPGTLQGVICVGNQRYSYILDKKVGNDATDIKHAMWHDQVSNTLDCTRFVNLALADPSTATSGTKGESLLSEGMRLKTIEVSPSGVGDDGKVIKVGVLYGDTDTMQLSGTGQAQNCIGGTVGSQWCALAEYQTIVTKRVR